MTVEKAIRELSIEYLGDTEELKEAKKMAIGFLKQCMNGFLEYQRGYTDGYKQLLSNFEKFLDDCKMIFDTNES